LLRLAAAFNIFAREHLGKKVAVVFPVIDQSINAPVEIRLQFLCRADGMIETFFQ